METADPWERTRLFPRASNVSALHRPNGREYTKPVPVPAESAGAPTRTIFPSLVMETDDPCRPKVFPPVTSLREIKWYVVLSGLGKDSIGLYDGLVVTRVGERVALTG